MSYTVLARKYRPQSFDELVGQGHVAKTIANAIAQERVAHAFLFTGVRGVGKTTTARILAKSLNCEKGPTASPCNACGPCMDITAGRDVDVQEIDGASNNSVDDVRRLQESLPFRPSRDRFKIVIVDEVHMLSTGAFNAFLKTLEEPPPHVKFIFATTESHKVPITIRSRCQRYDFRLIAQHEVAARVREILVKESITADDETVALVAREAAGSMRDALTLLDQIVAFGGQSLVSSEVARVLGIAGHDQVRALVEALLLGEPKRALTTIRDAEQNGADALHFAKQALEMLRDLVVLRTTNDEGELVHWVAEERKWATETTRSLEPAELTRLFAMTLKVVEEVGRSSSPTIALEMGALRVCTRPRLGSIEELVAKIEQLEARIARGEPPRGTGSAGGPSRGPSAAGGFGGRSSSPRNDASGMPEVGEVPSQASAILDSLGPRRAVVDEHPNAASPSFAPTPFPAPVAASHAAPEPAKPEPVPFASAPPASIPPGRPSQPTEERASAPPSIVPEPRPSQLPGGTALRRAALLDWEPIVVRLRESQPALAAIVEQGEARSITAEKIVVAFQVGSFYGRQASQPQSIESIAAAAAEILGTRPEVEIRLDAQPGQKTRTLADVERQRKSADDESRKREALGHPAVLDALDVFPEARGRADVRFDGE